MVTLKNKHPASHAVRMLPMRNHSTPKNRMLVPQRRNENQQPDNVLNYTPGPLAQNT